MLFITRLRRRLGRRPVAVCSAMIEGLESRQLLSGSPAVTSLRLVGPVKAVNQIVLTFDESLDPTAAQSGQSYVFGRIPPSGSNNNGITIGDVLGFLAAPKPKAIRNGKIQWSSAIYDDTTHSVTLTAIKPFRATTYFRLLRVKGTGTYAVKDTHGNVLNSGNDTLIHWSYHNGQSLRFTDADGDRVVISLKGPGHLYGFYQKGGVDPDPVIFVSNTNAKSVLTGTVIQGQTGDGVVHIAQLLGAPANTNLFNNSHFSIAAT